VQIDATTTVTLTWEARDTDGDLVVTSLGSGVTTPATELTRFPTFAASRSSCRTTARGPRGYRITVTNADGPTAVRTTAVGAFRVVPVPVGRAPVASWISHDRRRLLVANSGDGTVDVVDLGDLSKKPTTIAVGGEPSAIGQAAQPQAGAPSLLRYQVTTGRQGQSVFLDPVTFQRVDPWPDAPQPGAPVFGFTVAGTAVPTVQDPAALAPAMAALPREYRTCYLPDPSSNTLRIVSYDLGAQVARFAAQPAAVDVTDGPAPVTLSWAVDSADAVTLDPGGPVTGASAARVVAEPTRFRLTATATNGTSDSRSVDVVTYRCTVIPVGASPVAMALAPDRSTVWVLDQADGAVSVIDVASRTVVDTVSGVGTDAELLGFEYAPGVLVVARGRTFAVDPFRWQTDIDPSTHRIVYSGTSRSIRSGGPFPKPVGVLPRSGTVFLQAEPPTLVSPPGPIYPRGTMSRTVDVANWPGAFWDLAGEDTLIAIVAGQVVAVDFRRPPR
jgi:YVTN family beta-propeller protein